MRGKPSHVGEPYKPKRITPAGAGKTSKTIVFGRVLGDHPRRCGENKKRIMKRRNMLGSPPQVRGKPRFAVHSVVYDGITPAGAGKTSWRRNKVETIQDHPRRCGENAIKAVDAARKEGSPPQVRGKLSGSFSPCCRYRITPAGAGKTDGDFADTLIARDHPRRCGENMNP